MSDRESCTHHFEHVKQTRPFTEREYMQCTKCGHQNPLGLFQHWDTERDGPVPMARLETQDMPGDYGLPIRTDITRNNGELGTPVYAAKPGHVQATGWNINPGRSWNPPTAPTYGTTSAS